MRQNNAGKETRSEFILDLYECHPSNAFRTNNKLREIYVSFSYIMLVLNIYVPGKGVAGIKKTIIVIIYFFLPHSISCTSYGVFK